MLSLGGIANVFGRAAGRLVVFEGSALKEIGKIVAAKAASKLGYYQEASGPFPKWAPLAPSTIASKGGRAEPLVDTGELKERGISYVVKPTSVIVGSDLDRALFAELGTSKEPPRPFLGPAVLESKDMIVALIGGATVEAFGIKGRIL